jgi:tetratricopeptide (TPR) repeat protein
MTPRALTTAAASWWACLLLAGCTGLQSQKSADGFTAEDRKFFREAEAQLDGAAPPKGDKQTDSLLAMAQFYLEAKKFPLAERLFEKAAAADAKCIAAYAGLAKCHSETGRTDKAAEALNKGFAVDAKSPVLWNEAAVLRAKTGDMDGAIDAAQRALAAAPTASLYAENLGNLFIATARYQQAYDAYMKVLSPAEAHFRIGLGMRDKGDLQAADWHLKEALTLQPDHVGARRMLASMSSPPTTQAAVQQAGYEASAHEREPAVEPAVQPPPRTTAAPRSQTLPRRGAAPRWAPQR